MKKIPVMLVDDEQLVLEDLQSIIDWELYGFEVVCTAKNGKQALKKYYEQMPRVIFVDIQMPFMNGIEFARELRKMDKKTILVFLTAYSDFEYAKQAFLYRVDDYLLKNEITDKRMEDKLCEIRKQILNSGELQQFTVEGQNFMDKRGFTFSVRLAKEYMEEHFQNNTLKIDEIAASVQLSASRLSVLFKEELGLTVNEYLTEIRINQAKTLLKKGKYKIYEIAELVGYGSSQYFSQVFLQKTGITPRDYCRQIGWHYEKADEAQP